MKIKKKSSLPTGAEGEPVHMEPPPTIPPPRKRRAPGQLEETYRARRKPPAPLPARAPRAHPLLPTHTQTPRPPAPLQAQLTALQDQFTSQQQVRPLAAAPAGAEALCARMRSFMRTSGLLTPACASQSFQASQIYIEQVNEMTDSKVNNCQAILAVQSAAIDELRQEARPHAPPPNESAPRFPPFPLPAAQPRVFRRRSWRCARNCGRAARRIREPPLFLGQDAQGFPVCKLTGSWGRSSGEKPRAKTMM